MGQDKDSSVSERVNKWKGWVGGIKNPKWCKSNHSPLADRCPTNLQTMATWEKLLPRFLVEHDIIQYGISLWSVLVCCVPFTTSRLLPNYSLGQQSKSLRRPWHHVSTVQQQLKYWWTYRHCFGHQTKTQRHTDCCQEN